ncbi:MAG: hypothetical protein AMJ95_02390 [Omnitrophica WOR_2 bacterium SM23_72]|nr:MAG: hypothetical protein AMJ95_02390 [Omnitrophica WOR_2 bacterium SM23_72]
MKEGRLPHFSHLRTVGFYSRLATTHPPESVVVWTSFLTGLNPGEHGVFDFIMREPSNYFPYLTLNEISNIHGKTKIKLYRKGKAFWSILSQHKIPSYIYFCPNTFPPEALFGIMLSGMGVPDILGTLGKFSFYTTRAFSEQDKESRGRIIHVENKNNLIYSNIYGPKISSENFIKESEIPLKITPKPEEKGAVLEFQGNRLFIQEAKWSDWQNVSFKIGTFRKAHGIVKFYLKSVIPDFQLYMSPVNFDPRNPLFPITYPTDYSRKLSEKIGLFHTQGMPHDTWPLTEGILGEEVFLEKVDDILNERERILDEALKEFRGGLLFLYSDTLDVVQHMFWRYLDPQHPLYEKDSLYGGIIFKYYEKIDQIVGKVLKNLAKDTTLIVLSDHGFAYFRRSVHLNRWLLENGYLSLEEGINESKEFFEYVDWSKTKAYALGFGGIYLNRIGREYDGIVSVSELKDLKDKIKQELRQFLDPATGTIVVRNVYDGEEVFRGPYMNEGPDLFVGFNEGYRASWQTALGGVPKVLIEDNRKKWSGDHLVDPSLVPGVLFVNKKIKMENPSIVDIVPLLFDLFNVKTQDKK